MINWKDFEWHPIAESPNFGRSGKRHVDVFLSDGKIVWPVTLTKENYEHIHEPHMWPTATKWGYDNGEMLTEND